jgi:benzoyl-CoA reductase/2-hydroxyglutaryl-CoA dehydratase subunit BcrC/BadD/HgdB
MTETGQRKEIRAAAELKQLLTDYYHELDSAHESGQKVAWCTSVGPAEILRAFGFKVYFPENHAAMIGVQKAGEKYIPVANAAGYSPEICSYLTSDVGAYIQHWTPLDKTYGVKSIPKPDVLAYNTNQCRDVKEWFSYYSREFSAPLVGINSPKYIDEVEDMYVDDVAAQIERVVRQLEEITESKLDESRLEETVRLSLEATKLWKEILETAANAPSPLTFFDGTVHMAPIVVLRGDQRAVDYYQLLLEEMKERIAAGVGAVDGEKHRLYWEGMPIWGKLRALSEQFAELRTCVVASTYCNSWIFDDMKESDPVRSMALAYTKLFINRSELAKERYIAEMVKRFKVDGVIFHDSKTCPHNSNVRYGMPGRIKLNCRIPTLIINADLNDLRLYSEEQTKTNIEAFVEQMEGA